MTRALPLATAAVVLAAACGKPVDGTAAPDPALPAGDALVLRVEYVDGFVPYEYGMTRLPVISVYADGRVLTPGPEIAIYPGPALPAVEERRISTMDVARLAGLALNAGVGKGLDFGQPDVFDAPSALFIVHTASGSHRSSVNALTTDTGVTPAQASARAKIHTLLDALTDLPRTLGADKVGASSPYRAATIAAVSSGYTAPADIPAPPEKAWPGPDLPGEPVANRPPLGCVTATGEQARAVLDAAATANSATGWTSAGKTWQVHLRPLLPDETDCAGLTRTS